MQPHLGDVPGGLEPVEFPPYRSAFADPMDRDGVIERWARRIIGAVVVFVVLVVGALLLWIAVLLAAPSSLAHGPADWIQRGGFKNAAGELCCGERDCLELADKDVKVTATGYEVTLRTPTLQGIAVYRETVPFHEASPSPDGRYWRCQWGGARKCFFAPPSAT